MAKRRLGLVEVTADKIVCALIDRLVTVEKRLASMQKDIDLCVDMIAENQVRVTEDGVHIRVRAYADDLESSDEYDVELQPTAIARRTA